MEGQVHGETNERIDGVDDLQPQPNDLRLRHGAGDGMAWTEVTDADGRQVGLIEGRLNESGLEVTRAHVRVGTSETEAAELLRSHLNGTGHTVGFASTAETSIPSGTRRILRNQGSR